MNFLKKLSVRWKILLIVFLGSFFIVSLVGLSYYTINQLNASSKKLQKISSTIENIVYLQKERDNIYNVGKLAFTLNRDNEEEINKLKDNYRSSIKAYNVQVKQMEENLLNIDSSEVMLKDLSSFPLIADSLVPKILDNDWNIDFSIIQRFHSSFDNSYKHLMTLYDKNNAIQEELNLQNEQLTSDTYMVLFLSGLIALALTLSISLYISKIFVSSIRSISKIVEQLSKGKMTRIDDIKTKDEIGNIMHDINFFIDKLRNTSDFASSIGRGEFDMEFEKLSDDDTLGASLLEMRESLLQSKQDNIARNWITEGLAKFADILRMNNDNIELLSSDLISNLVKYIDANQGGIFLVNDDDENNQFLEMTSCYAYDRQKYLKKRIEKGESLVGQCWVEGESILMTEVPNSYVSITSGLGDSNPKCILLLPLKVNEEVLGVIEFAAFKVFEKTKIEFLEKISESIASTLKGVKITASTRLLLDESTQMQAQMKEQEEEMRQNIEEMTATSEESERRLASIQDQFREDEARYQKEIAELKAKLNQ